ncbi:unnamed protein product [Bemisia tabaci]|uniref:TLDc domain-containing protein n=1 Tax=Bemisia tabaci TaxID=7038 RepID=A0A9P0F6W5_BEMTA|nr:PREDICTED: uncharacterized protein LOC109036778 [Bemisia tabaci]CAH0391608.1 unnamed protein product [Bemisia tabaci]
MGNHNTHPDNSKRSLSRNSSSVDIQEKSQLLPIEKLAKLLANKSLTEDAIEGIGASAFKRYLFPNYPELSRRLFSFLAVNAGLPGSSHVISPNQFKLQSEKLLGILAEEEQVLMYVRMFADNSDEITPEQFRDLLFIIYKIAMDHYAEGPQSCRQTFKTIQAVVDSAFHKKNVVGVNYMTTWLLGNCPRLVILLHRYIVHILSTSYRILVEKQATDKPPELELTTPVLEKSSPLDETPQPLLPLSQVWLLTTTLPPLYTRPTLTSPSINTSFSAQNFLAKFLDFSCPSHWTILYNSSQHGLGANRFLHHTLSYRGPTLTFIRGENDLELCCGATDEWRESHVYWGREECICLQILPLFKVLDRGPKLMYLNTSIRGYPLGLRAGKDTRKPCIEVNNSFDQVMFNGVPFRLHSVEVWGCGTPQSREIQLDIKQWQLKQVEKQRQVKMSSKDWLDHPDRYLLEMAGRQNYTPS